METKEEVKSTTYAVDGKRVKVTHWNATKGSGKELTTKITTTFDFGKCTEAEILKFAARNRVIAWRNGAKIKDLTMVEAKELDNQTIDCSVVVERKAKAIDPLKAKIISLTNGMSMDDIQKALELFAAAKAKETDESVDTDEADDE